MIREGSNCRCILATLPSPAVPHDPLTWQHYFDRYLISIYFPGCYLQIFVTVMLATCPTPCTSFISFYWTRREHETVITKHTHDGLHEGTTGWTFYCATGSQWLLGDGATVIRGAHTADEPHTANRM